MSWWKKLFGKGDADTVDTTDHEGPRLGDRVVLKPQGLIGRVSEIDSNGDEQHFLFDHIVVSTWLPVHRSGRWRPVMSSAKAFCSITSNALVTSAWANPVYW